VKHGYRKDSPTSVQTLDLRMFEPAETGIAELTFEDSDAWQAAFAHMNNVDENRRITHERILRAILLEKCYASIRMDGDVVGCGLGVLQAGYLGVFDIVVDADHRRQGNGSRLMRALLAWSMQQGAHTAYLQVMWDNEPALRMYEELGFREKYQYWYRIEE
jgi:ribosomal protein S18 acetylase RimI-like enzyme